jgi:DNA-binding CsgD family transcriptional regulator
VDAVYGALQLIAVRFPSGAQPNRVLAEIDRVQANGSIRVLDMLLVAKDADGALASLSFVEDDDMGEILSRFLPIGTPSSAASGEYNGGLRAAVQSLPADTTGLFVLIEHRWAQGLFDAIDEEGGALFDAAFLPPELALTIASEVATLEAVTQSIDAAQATEAEARLTAATALAEMDQVMAASTRIRAAAIVEALHALTIAGLVETAATHEAIDALTAAGLIIGYADETTARAVTTDAAIVAAVDEAASQAIVADLAAVAVAEQTVADTQVAASITPAELRVLRYLSTPLTFALIADKLGITRGAAKMRAERAYRRLGVHTRAEAVQRARELRTLP